MSEHSEKMTDEIVENLKRPSAWIRVLFMAGYVVALYVTGIILMVLTLAQILFSLFSGDDNSNLRRLGAGLSAYVSQILAFLTYNSDSKPFPFMPFPRVDADIPPADVTETDVPVSDVPVSDVPVADTPAAAVAAEIAPSVYTEEHATSEAKRSARRKKPDEQNETFADE